MTLVLSVRGKTTIWMLADRRLTVGRRVVRDDAVKLLRVEADDGNAIVGYAGLGATLAGTQPSDWMGRVLRGRTGTIYQLLDVLAAAGLRELPRHIGPGAFDHAALVAALVDKVPAIYVVGTERSAIRSIYSKRYNRIQSTFGQSPPFSVAGSGTAAASTLVRSGYRRLLRLIKFFEKGRVSAALVADEMAKISYEVHLKEPTVGPRSMAIWTDRHGGGGHIGYTGTSRESDGPCYPTISKGTDIGALVSTAMRVRFGNPLIVTVPFPELDVERLNEELRKLPSEPDERLK